MKKKVILDPAGRRLETIFYPADLARLHDMADLVWAQDDPMPMRAVDVVRDEVEAIITGGWRYGATASFPKLRAIMEVGGGFPADSDVDYATCFARDIHVLSCSPAFAPAVAEMGVGLAIAASRQIVQTDAAFRRGEANWSHTDLGDSFMLYGKPVGFIGYGNIGRELHRLMAAFRCQFRVYDPWLRDDVLAACGVIPADLEALLSESRFIFNMAVPTASNEKMLNRDTLGLIRPDAVFINLGRARQVDYEALTDLLAENRFSAALDVYPEEPLAPDHPLRSMSNVILSSHRAGAIHEALHNIGHLVTNDLEAVLQGLPPQAMQKAEPEYLKLRG